MKTYHALSVVTPAGSRIRSGRKTVEVRKWRPDDLPLCDMLIVQNVLKWKAGRLETELRGRIF